MNWCFLRRVIIGILFPILTPIPIQSQPPDCSIAWSPPILISNDTVPSNLPQIVHSASVLHIVWYGNDLGYGEGIQYCRSTNNGYNFSPQRTLVTYDSSFGIPGHLAAENKTIYLAYLTPSDTAPFYSIGLLRSTTAGETWEIPIRIRNGAIPQLIAAKDSCVYIQYLWENNRRGLLQSSDYGNTWIDIVQHQPPLRAIAATSTLLHGIGTVGFNNPEVAYFRSTNNGQTWSEPNILSHNDFVRSTQPSISANEVGNPVVVWNDTGTVFFRRSRDKGLYWYPEIQVSTKKGAVYSNVASSNSYIAVAWDNELASGGGVNVRISNQSGISFCSIDSAATNPIAGEPSLALDNNTIFLVWSEVINTTAEIFFRRGHLPIDPKSIPPTSVILLQNYPNPFNWITNFEFKIANVGLVTLKVFDVLGREVATLVNEVKSAGTYQARWDAREFASGVYYYRLEAMSGIASNKSTLQTKKMVLLR